jgi:hypothetical protein
MIVQFVTGSECRREFWKVGEGFADGMKYYRVETSYSYQVRYTYSWQVGYWCSVFGLTKTEDKI